MTTRTEAPVPERPCPRCGRSAVVVPGRASAVCGDCQASARCSHDRPVVGANTRFTAMGITVWHADGAARDECVATIGSGRVWVDGQECRIVTTRAGGVAVEVLG